MKKDDNMPILFDTFPKLEANIPWIRLGPMNTPVERMGKLEDKLELDSLWVKRDDITSPIYGGNKPRKLEFILGDAKKRGYKRVMTTGGFGSNFCVANAAMCKEIGLKAVAVLVDQPMTSYVKKNLLFNIYCGNELIYIKKKKRLKWIKFIKRIFNPKTYFMLVPGGSVPLGTLGFVNAAFELGEQVKEGLIPEPDHIFVPSGSAGTVAGLVLGIKLANLKSKIHAVQISSYTGYEGIVKLAYETWELMKKYDETISDVEIDNLIFERKYFGDGYALPTDEGIEAIEIIRETENLELEITYSGKTFAAFLDFVKENREEIKNKTILFWNTYNSIDVSNLIQNINYKELPKQLHWIFEEDIISKL